MSESAFPSEFIPATESNRGEPKVQLESPDVTTHLEIDSTAATEGEEVFGEDDRDSAVRSDSGSNTSTSITSSVLNYTYENGRRYHAYRNGQYFLPNDDQEQERLDLQHHISLLILEGNLFRSLIKNPQIVLDMGTGTGIWAIDFADKFPSAQVVGTDLSPIQPSWVPPNCKFMVDDLESNWAFESYGLFDFIHGRALGGSIKDWKRLYQQAYNNLKPGGWIEMQEYEGCVFSDDDPELKRSPYILKWQENLDEATTAMGKKLAVARKQKEFLQEAGFVELVEEIYYVPCGRWALGRELKILGIYQLEHMADSVEPYTLVPFTRILGWSLEETQVLIAKVRSELRNKGNHLHLRFHCVYGRRPMME